jgi:HSP20 family protein
MSTGAPARTDLSDWPGSPLSTLHPMAASPKPIPVEQYPQDGCYVIRLEVPGVDPADLTVCVQTGTLSVRAERPDSAPTDRQSEFSYGSFARHIALPLGANPHDVSALYHNGLLTVRVGVEPTHDDSPRVIDVEVQP